MDDLFALDAEAARLKADPTTARWLEDAYKSLADGSFDERVRNQPSPDVVAERLKARADEAI